MALITSEQATKPDKAKGRKVGVGDTVILPRTPLHLVGVSTRIEELMMSAKMTELSPTATGKAKKEKAAAAAAAAASAYDAPGVRLPATNGRNHLRALQSMWQSWTTVSFDGPNH